MSQITIVAYQRDQRDRTSYMVASGSCAALLFFSIFINSLNEIAGYLVGFMSLIGTVVFIILDYRSLGTETRGFISLDEENIFIEFSNNKITLPAKELGHIYFSYLTDYPGMQSGALRLLSSTPSPTLNLFRILHKGEYYTYSVNLLEETRPHFNNILNQYRLYGVQVDIQDVL